MTWAEDVSEIEVVETPKLEDLRAKHANDDHAFMLMALLERSGTKSLGEFSEMMREPETCCMSNAQKRAYHARSTEEDNAASAELKRELESLQASILPPELIDSSDPKHAAWARELMD